jgi:putative membrane protein
MSALSISLITPALAAGHWARPGAWWYGPGAWWPAVPLLWLAVIAIAVTAAFLLMRRTVNRPGSPVAEAKLADRYATGDITEDEYRERLAVLRAHER